jgi:hypothetical protein
MKDLKAIRFIKGTKISHDYSGDVVQTFSYRDLCERGVEAIGIPAKQNGLVIVDIDVVVVYVKKPHSMQSSKSSLHKSVPAPPHKRSAKYNMDSFWML